VVECTCKGKGFIPKVEGKKIAWSLCSCKKEGYVETNFPQLKGVPASKKWLSPWNKDYYIHGPLVKFHAILKAFLLKAHESFDIKIIHGYDLVEEYLGHTEWKIDSLYERKLLVIYMGISEVENRQLGNLVVRLAEARKILANPTWIYCDLPAASTVRVYKERFREYVKGIESVSSRDFK